MPRSHLIRARRRDHLPSTGESDRCRAIEAWFGIDRTDARGGQPRASWHIVEQLRPLPGTITMIGGASGSGKSSLLRQLRAAHGAGASWIDLPRIRLPSDRELINCFGRRSIENALALLSRVGLGDAWCYLKTPAQLSDGQRWRFRLAMALHRADRTRASSTVLVCDEFAALLDRVTAAVVARALRRTVDGSGGALSAIVATSHDDLMRALAPDRIVRCDFDACAIASADFSRCGA